MGALLRGAGLGEHCTGSWGTLSRQKKHQGTEVWVLGVVAQRLHLYLLMTFDHRRGILELHGRKWPTSFQALGRSLFAARTGANKYFVLDNSESETTVRKRKPQIAIR